MVLPLKWISVPLFAAAYVISAYDILMRSAKNIRKGRVFDENFLMSVASVGAMCLGDFTEGVAVIVLYQLGEMLQGMAVKKSRRSISELMDIRPDHADMETEDGIVRVHPEKVPVGAVIVVKAGDKVPLDGMVVRGSSTLDTAALTGESMPRAVQEGDQVLSGCVNMSGVLRMQTTRLFGESTVSKILHMVEHAGKNKARPEQFITRFARVYTPIVVYLALALAILPPFFDGFNFARWIERALTFLVISCPCALVISVPLSFFSGIGGASRKGILIKGAAYLEKLADCGTVVFDKTGTLTCGKFEVTGIRACRADEQEVLRCAAAVEAGSNHPIARSICEKWTGNKGNVENVQEVSGLGVSGMVDGHVIHAGNRQWMERHGVACDQDENGLTLVHVAKDRVYLGAIELNDTVKAGAPEALNALRGLGILNQVMLSGDKAETARRIGQELNLDRVIGELLPGDKVRKVEELLESRQDNKALVYVGDGINDAPVLARADVGIAMGAMGSDAAIEAADVVLMDDDMQKLPAAVRIARGTMQICRQNIVFALGVKALVLLLGAMGIASMWMAVFADVGVCLLAVANAMRAMRIK